jgi:hypothetical protein
MTIGLVILGIFLLAAALMFFRVMPAMLALPLMAAAIGGVEVVAGRLAFEDLSRAVLADGATRLSEAMVIAMLGGILSSLMQRAGVAESIVHEGAELAGDNPWTVAVIMLGIATMLFTTVGGLGAVIMLGTIVLPILASMGVREHIAAGILLFGISLGGLLNAGNWVMYRSVLGVDPATVSSYAVSLFACAIVVGVGFVTLELWRTRLFRLRGRSLVRLAAGIGAIALVAVAVRTALQHGVDLGAIARGTTTVVGLALVAVVAWRIASGGHRGGRAHWSAYAIPIVPLALILAYGMPFVPAFLAGLLYAMASTYRRGILNMTSRAVIEGTASVAPAVALMIGIGMLLSAILGPTAAGPGQYWHASHPPGTQWPVLTTMKPLLQVVTPTSALGYVAVFTLLGPLALYRGPLNVWGLGYGVGGVLLATGVSPAAVMGVLMSLGMIQGISDPTNTANVWIANEVRLDVTTLMWRTLPYAWVIAASGLVVAGLRFWG